MDTSDPEITFDSSGQCNHCLAALNRWKSMSDSMNSGSELRSTIERLRRVSNSDYNCILGLSGGVDSSYLALKAHDWGLRPLVVHVDAGWNSEIAVRNIEGVVKSCNYDLHTIVVNWDAMRELQLAFLRSGVANQDVPQDHAFFAHLYHFAIDNKIRYVLNGGNVASESIVPESWQWSAMDAKNIRAIYSRFGSGEFPNFQLISFWQYYIEFPLLRRMSPVRPLNQMWYSKAKAAKELESRTGWTSYERKHEESVWTRFFQNYYLPVRFGWDKRRPHLSSLIVSGQVTRLDALEQLEKPLYEEREMRRDSAYIRRKLRLSEEEFQDLMETDVRDAGEFDNWSAQVARLKKVQVAASRLSGRRVAKYS